MNDNKPKFNPSVICPLCKKGAVALVIDQHEGDSVVWCEDGHVSVESPGEPMPAKLVFNFHAI